MLLSSSSSSGYLQSNQLSPIHPLPSFVLSPFFFIGAEEGGGEKGSLEVFAMTGKSRGNEDGVGLSVGLRRCMCILSKSTEGTCLTNIDKDRGRVKQIN